jgi:hypothetical protein
MVLAVAIAAAGCFEPGEVDEGLICDGERNNACPEGQTCGADNICYWGEGDPDAGADSLCDMPLDCPDPSGGRVAICGQIYDIGTSDEIRDPGANGTICDPLAPDTTGPCALTVAFYDMSMYVNDPDGTPELATAQTIVDDCGRFRGVDIERPGLGQVGVVVDDPPAVAIDADPYMPTFVTFSLSADQAEAGTTVVATHRNTDAGWMTSAGDPFGGGTTFADKGAHFAVFFNGDTHAEGVAATVAGAEVPEDDFYFTDTVVWNRLTVDGSRLTTGPNGAALVVNSVVTDHGGMGGEPEGCSWPTFLSASIEGVIHHVDYFTEDDSNPGEPCPQ